MQKPANMRLIIFIISLSICNVYTHAQWRQSSPDIFDEAYEFYSWGEYGEALPLFTPLLRDHENNDYLRYLVAVCYLNIDGQRQRALPFLEQATRNITFEHIPGSFNEKSAPLESLYYLGLAYRLAYRFDESIESFRRLKSMADNRYDMQQIEREMAVTKNAALFYKNREDITEVPIKASPGVDPAHSNIIISGDESTIVYVEPQRFYDAVFFSTNSGRGWSKPVNITTQLGSDGLAYPVSLSFDGKQLYLYQYDRLSNTNLYLSQRVNSRWSGMEKLSDNINSEAFEQHASLTKDGNTLYFSSNRLSGEGGFDIYHSRLDENNEWGPAENLGSLINTPFDESYPFISPDGKTLFFSSRGHTGMGGYDIFVTHKKPDGNWTTPRNLGYPVNTPDDDTFFIPVKEGTTAYLNSRKEENNDRRKFKKISSFEVDSLPFSTLALNVSKQVDVKKPDAEIFLKVQQMNPGNTKEVRRTLIPGEDHELVLEWGEYSLEFSSEGNITKSISVTIPEYYPDKKYYVNAKLNKITAGQTGLAVNDTGQAKNKSGLPLKSDKIVVMEIEPVLFGFDRHDLDDRALAITSEVAGLLNEHTKVNIELRGYTDALGPSAYNKHLAGKRAESVAGALVTYGINKDRISIIPVGMNSYIARNTTTDGRDNPEGRRFNRRVELVFSNLPVHIEFKNILYIPENLKK